MLFYFKKDKADAPVCDVCKLILQAVIPDVFFFFFAVSTEICLIAGRHSTA
jgi:hypothetical protein